VRDQRDQEAERDADEQPVQHVAVERQLERVEPDVDAELGVGDAERGGVEELLDRLPVALGRDPGDDADHHRDADAEQPQPLDDHRPVPGDRVLRAGDRHEHRPRPVGDGQRQRHQATDQQAGDEEQHDVGEQHRGEHAGETDLTEPEPVHVEADQTGATEQQQHQDPRHDEQDPGTAVSVGAPTGGRMATGHAPGVRFSGAGRRPAGCDGNLS
jgi:hypothetical protein